MNATVESVKMSEKESGRPVSTWQRRLPYDPQHQMLALANAMTKSVMVGNNGMIRQHQAKIAKMQDFP